MSCNSDQNEPVAKRPKTWNIKYGARKKKCKECSKEWPVRKEICQSDDGGCGAVFEKLGKTAEEKLPACSTNMTDQKRLLKKRALILQRDHNVHSVTFLLKRSVTSNRVTTTFDTVATPGWGESFVGTRKDPSQYRDQISNVLIAHFKQHHEEENASIRGTSANTERSTTEESSGDAQSEPSISAQTGFTEENQRGNDNESDNDNDENENQDECTSLIDSEIKIKSKKEIEAFDVLPIYAAASSGDDFWLFFVLQKKQKQIVGKWLNKRSEAYEYELQREDKISYRSIMRIGSAHDGFYVLPKFQATQQTYVLSKEAVGFLSREIASFVSGTD